MKFIDPEKKKLRNVLVIQFLDVTKFAQDTFDKHWILC
jgi:hypothetical protein